MTYLYLGLGCAIGSLVAQGKAGPGAYWVAGALRSLAILLCLIAAIKGILFLITGGGHV